MADNLLTVIVIIIVLVILTMIAYFWIGWLISNRRRIYSPFTGLPLRRATEISYANLQKVHNFMTEQRSYDNKMFNVRKAAFCRETGRIFPNAMSIFGEISVDWDFLRKRYPGNWISWGSLNKDQQEAIRLMHDPLDGFQTEFSCPEIFPRSIEDKYIYIKPGPLYVDFDSKILLGWKSVPGTILEVLVVQKPFERHY